MRFKHILIFLLAVCSTQFAKAQLKIGYTNLDLVMSYLPEVKQVQRELEIYQRKVAEKLETKKKYYDVKLQEYSEKAQRPDATPESMAPFEKELQRLQQEMQKSLAKSEEDLMKKQYELMGPIMEKLEQELKALAEENGFDYILNSATGGSSIVLHATESHNVTELLFARLGIKIPEQKN